MVTNTTPIVQAPEVTAARTQATASGPTASSAVPAVNEPSNATLQAQVVMLQHQISTLHRSGAEARGTVNWRHRGRAFRRLVCLSDNIADILSEADRRGTLVGGNHTHSERQDTLYKAYNELKKWIPDFWRWALNESNIAQLDGVIKQLSDGADAARADDACHLKFAVVTWLMDANPRLLAHDKTGRGLYNDTTARLICPAEFDWDNAEHRDKIRNWDPLFLITANSWPRFLYKDERYDPQQPSEGLFRGSLLVKALKLIFTSPSSVDEEMDPALISNGRAKRRRGERRTRTHIAGLLGMKKVVPRAIAYVAVQLRFALSSCGSWRLVDGVFDHTKFYNQIIGWFEDIKDAEEKQFIDDLLLWWNRQVFGQVALVDYSDQVASCSSVAASFKKRCVMSTPEGGRANATQHSQVDNGD